MTKFKDIIMPFITYKSDYVRGSTLSQYDNVFENHLKPHFGEKDNITQEDVNNYLYIKSQAGLSKKALESHIVALKSSLNWANKTGIFSTNKFKANYPAMAKDPIEIKPLTINEAKLFAKYCEDNFTFITFSLYITLFTGLRSAEVCGLQWKDIDLTNGVLSVNKIVTRICQPSFLRKEGETSSSISIGPPKTPSSLREVPLSKQLLRYFKGLCSLMNPDFYIATNNSSPAEPSMLRQELLKIIEATDIPKIRVHDLRHTFATRCISSGIDPKTVSVLLGHSTIVTTLKLYTHVDDEAKTSALNKLSKKMAWK